MTDQMHRRRGAQPNNTNALKHGYYSPRLQLHDSSALDLPFRTALDEEIAMLRSYTLRVFEMASQVDDLDRSLAFLNALGAAVYRLSGLLRTQRILDGGGESELRAFLNQVLAEVTTEMGITPKQ